MLADRPDFTARAKRIGLSEAQYLSFDSEGYLQLNAVLEGAFLSRVQEEFHRVEEETREDWLRTVAGNPKHRPYRLGETAHVVFPIAPHGDVFLDLLEHPCTIAIAAAFMGPDMLMSDNALHVKPAGTPSHVGWHRDSKTWKHEQPWSREDRIAWESMRLCQTPFSKIKIFFFVHDVDESTSPFSVVPGSHRWDPDEIPAHEELNDMPGRVKILGKAGDAVLWNGCILHAAMHNTGNQARRMLFYNYVHFGQHQYDPCRPAGEFAARIRARSPLCRQLFGLERMKRKGRAK